MATANTFDVLFDAIADIMGEYAKQRSRSMANYVRGLSVKVRGINCHGNVTAIRKNYGIADEMDQIAFAIQHDAPEERSPERFMESRVKRAHDLADGAIRPRS